MIDGIVVAAQCCVAALVITTDGRKVPVGLWLGDTAGGLLVVIDGAKALATGVRKVFGEHALIQRCTAPQAAQRRRLPAEGARREDRSSAGLRLQPGRSGNHLGALARTGTTARRGALTPLLADLPGLVDRQLPEGNADLAQLRVLARSALEREDQDAQGLVSQIRSTIAQPEVPIESEEARVMSFHKSKGLTAEVVVLAGLVDGLMPWADDAAAPPEEQAADRGEQRRLFYVGMTRTRRALASRLRRNSPPQWSTAIASLTAAGEQMATEPSPARS